MKRTLLTTLSFSGGQQSSALLWMIIRGEINPPDPFVVLNADPGMENQETYKYIAKMKKICDDRGIVLITAAGGNLYDDILTLKKSGKTRFDTPPYWTKNRETGKKGRLMQGCTQIYKIKPMDRWIRRFLEMQYGISAKSKRIDGTVVKLIGFSLDESHRVKEPSQKYVRFEYPLIDKQMTKDDVLSYFTKIGEDPPPRSICNACFANSASDFRKMRSERPDDFAQAVAIDDVVRDWSQIGVRDEVYVCANLIPLRGLDGGSSIDDGEDWSCDSGYCFV